jgi:hypothetical protein
VEPEAVPQSDETSSADNPLINQLLISHAGKPVYTTHGDDGVEQRGALLTSLPRGGLPGAVSVELWHEAAESTMLPAVEINYLMSQRSQLIIR